MEKDTCKLSDLVTRLEKVCLSLEGKNMGNISTSLQSVENIATFSDYWNKQIKNLIDITEHSKTFNDQDLEKVTDVLIEGVCFNQDILVMSESFIQPSKEEAQNTCKKLNNYICKAAEVKKARPDLELFVEVINNCLDAFTWPFSGNSGYDTVKTYAEAVDFPGNKIFLKKNPEWSKWVKLVKTIMKEMVVLVEKSYKAGLKWNSKGNSDASLIALGIGELYRKNFIKKEVECPSKDCRNDLMNSIKNVDLKSHLKPTVTEDKTVFNPSKVIEVKTEQAEGVKFTKSSEQKVGRRATLIKKGKAEEYKDMTGTVIIQNFENETKEIEVEKLQTKSVINIYNCIDCTLKVSKKINSIKITNCDNIKIYVESLMSSFEITNSVKISVIVTGTVNLFSLDNCTDTSMYLPPSSQGAQVYATKCTSSHIKLINETSEEVGEYLLPEQFAFCLNESRTKITARVSELYDY